MNYILLGYRNPACKLYTPKINRWKLGMLCGFVGVCLVTPATNWMIPLGSKILNKFNPLWIYN